MLGGLFLLTGQYLFNPRITQMVVELFSQALQTYGNLNECVWRFGGNKQNIFQLSQERLWSPLSSC